MKDYEGPIGLSPHVAYLYKLWDIRQTNTTRKQAKDPGQKYHLLHEPVLM